MLPLLSLLAPIVLPTVNNLIDTLGGLARNTTANILEREIPYTQKNKSESMYGEDISKIAY